MNSGFLMSTLEAGSWKTTEKSFQNTVGKYLAHNSILSQNYLSSEKREMFHKPLLNSFSEN